MNKADKRKGKVRKKIPITMQLTNFFSSCGNVRGNLYALN